MLLRTVGAALIAVFSMKAVIIDQIAIVVGTSIVKDSDIGRDIRVTEFLNGQPLDLSENVRKETASRLIDQIFIRKEIELGNYPVATQQEADRELEGIVRTQFKSEAALQERLRMYGITAPDLRSHFLWQLTVLRFIDLRFKPAVLVTNSEIETYYKQHADAFRRSHPTKYSLADVREEIVDTLTAERVNKLFFSWLEEQRKQTKIKYFERSLQ
ncbi:MAG TPA: hypothetical protein VH477_03015 [Bryobacteraceae bacterium]|jgi:argonaute-like protein implicated in RNA metabolism and viral defense